MAETIDCIVIGAGPAGLLTSATLTARGVAHIVLDRGRVGQSWRTQRWDAFMLNPPGWASALPTSSPITTVPTTTTSAKVAGSRNGWPPPLTA